MMAQAVENVASKPKASELAQSSYLAGLLLIAMHREAIRIAIHSDESRAHHKDVQVIALVCNAERVWLAHRSPLLKRGKLSVTLGKWQSLTPTISEVTLEAGLVVSELVENYDGSVVATVGDISYYIPDGKEMFYGMQLAVETKAQQLSMPDVLLSDELAGLLAELLFATPPESGRLLATVRVEDAYYVRPELVLRMTQDELPVQGSKLQSVYKNAIPYTNEVNLPGLEVTLRPPGKTND